jgi:hypothetical protein
MSAVIEFKEAASRFKRISVEGGLRRS